MKFFAHSTFLNSKELEALLQIKTGLFLSFFFIFFLFWLIVKELAKRTLIAEEV